VVLAGTPHQGYTAEAISVHYEPHPRPMSVALANRLADYSLPKQRNDFHPEKGPNADFSFAVPFRNGAGIYTVVVWVRSESGGPLIGASNISIEVHEPPRFGGRLRGAR
jgi:hypothetical protein